MPEQPPSAERARALGAMGRHLVRQGKRLADARRWCEEAVSCAVAVWRDEPTRGTPATRSASRSPPKVTSTDAFDELVAAVGASPRPPGDIGEPGVDLPPSRAGIGRRIAGRLDDVVDVLLEHANFPGSPARTPAHLRRPPSSASPPVRSPNWVDGPRRTRTAAAVDTRRSSSGVGRDRPLDPVRTLDVGRGRFERAEGVVCALPRRWPAGCATRSRQRHSSTTAWPSSLAGAISWTPPPKLPSTKGLDAVANTGDDDMTARLCVTALRDRGRPP